MSYSNYVLIRDRTCYIILYFTNRWYNVKTIISRFGGFIKYLLYILIHRPMLIDMLLINLYSNDNILC